MAVSTRTYKKADNTTGTRLVGENGQGEDTGGVTLFDANGNVLIGQKARAGSLPVTLSTEDIAALASQTTLALVLSALQGTLGVTGTVGVGASVLPTGAATSAAQTTGNTSLSSIDTKTPALSSGRVPVDGSGVTQPVSVTALPASLTAAGNLKVAMLEGGIASGTAGTPASEVVTVQGVSGGIAFDVNTELPIAAALSDGAANPTTPTIGAADLQWNGATWERRTGNVEGTAITSAARTATLNSNDITNPNGRGLLIFLNVTAASGTGGLTLRVQAKDPVSGNYYALNAAPTAVTATGLQCYNVSVGAQSTNAAQNVGTALPRTFRINVTHGDSSSYTYSVGYSLMV